VRKTRYSGFFLFLVVPLAARAQIDPVNRQLVQFGYNAALQGHPPQSVYAYYYRNQPQFLRKAPAQYGTAFLQTETDENDLTYFIIHQAEIIRRALKDLHDYVARKSSETRACLDALQKHPELNHRQQALISHAVRHPGFAYKIAAHGTRQAVTYATARADLLGLARLKLLEQRKAGRAFVFVAPKDLEARLRSRGR